MTERYFFIIIAILLNNFSFSQIMTDEGSVREQLECYDDILLPLIYDNITCTSHNFPAVPPIPLEAIQNPTKEDTLRYKKEMKKYYEEKEGQNKKISVFIDDVLYSVKEFSPSLNDTCNFSFPNPPNIKLSQKQIIEMPDNLTFELSSTKNADLNLKLGQIFFDNNKSTGHLIIQIRDMFGLVSTKCYRIKFESGMWRLVKR